MNPESYWKAKISNAIESERHQNHYKPDQKLMMMIALVCAVGLQFYLRRKKVSAKQKLKREKEELCKLSDKGKEAPLQAKTTQEGIVLSRTTKKTADTDSTSKKQDCDNVQDGGDPKACEPERKKEK